MAQERHYTPEVGTRVRLRTLSDCLQILICRVVNTEDATVTCERTSTARGEHDGELVTVPLNLIDTPVGWKPRYTIHVQPSQVEEVLAWLARGIVVRSSQYIGDGSIAFQPADNAGVPHWRFGEVTDTIAPDQTRDCIRVVKLETKCGAGLPAPCHYCNGTGQHAMNPALENQTASTQHCATCGLHLGFSSSEAWHSRPSQYYSYPKDNPCATPRAAGECWVCSGSGQGTRYLSEMEPRRERKVAIATLERQGWKIWYQKRGQYWMQERETVVKDWGEELTC